MEAIRRLNFLYGGALPAPRPNLTETPLLAVAGTVTGCASAGLGRGDCKKKLAGNINQLMEKPRAEKKQLLQDAGALDSIIAQGCQKAQDEARTTLRKVCEWAGLSPREGFGAGARN